MRSRGSDDVDGTPEVGEFYAFGLEESQACLDLRATWVRRVDPEHKTPYGFRARGEDHALRQGADFGTKDCRRAERYRMAKLWAHRLPDLAAVAARAAGLTQVALDVVWVGRSLPGARPVQPAPPWHCVRIP